VVTLSFGLCEIVLTEIKDTCRNQASKNRLLLTAYLLLIKAQDMEKRR
jgi:hypothetical protein